MSDKMVLCGTIVSAVTSQSWQSCSRKTDQVAKPGKDTAHG